MEEPGSVSVEENTVVYRGFVIPARGRPPFTSTQMNEFRNQCLNAVGHRLAGYIWQEESFRLDVVAKDEYCDFPHLQGSTHFGDNIDDEWFIVDLLFHLTEIFPNLAVQMEDSDGDFLLIEAAESLPSWLTPSTSPNRVFIFDGSLHIVPVGATPALLTNVPALHKSPSIDAALVALRDFGAGLTRASKPVQRLLNTRRRLSRTPATHCAHCRLPARVAAILRADPRLVAPAVRAFYLRDPIDLRACRAAAPAFPPDDDAMVTRRVTMTRCLYAQLTSQKFVADRRSLWAGKEPTETKAKKAWNLGLRIACGFEIIMNRKGSKEKRSERKDEEQRDKSERSTEGNPDFDDGGGIDDDSPEWKTFVASLETNGFFQTELKGSKKWEELMEKAKQFYRETVLVAREKEEERFYVSDGLREKIETILASPECVVDVAEMRAEEAHLEPEDGDDWMAIDPKELDEALEKYRRKQSIVDNDGGTGDAKTRNTEGTAGKLGGGGGGGVEEEYDLDRISKTFKKFVEHVSELDGVEFPDSSNSRQSSVMSNSRQLLDSDDSSDDEDDDDRHADASTVQTNQPPYYPGAPPRVTSSRVPPLAKSGGQATTSASVSAPSFSNDLTDLPTGDFDIDVDSFAKALETLMSSSKSANRSSSGFATDDDEFDQSEGDSDDDEDDDFLIDDDDKGIETIKSYMKAMDSELAKTEMGKSFARVASRRPESPRAATAEASSSRDDVREGAGTAHFDDGDDDGVSPLDIDLTLVKNVLESYSTQPGFAGPATNILNSMGISLPDPERPSSQSETRQDRENFDPPFRTNK